MSDSVEQPQPERSERDNIIGEFTPFTYEITCQREPDAGIAWMACIKELSICALGDTPLEAGENLFKALTVGGNGKLYERNCKSLLETGSTWRAI